MAKKYFIVLCLLGVTGRVVYGNKKGEIKKSRPQSFYNGCIKQVLIL